MADNGRKITVECFRFDPDKDSEPRFQSYEVPFVKDSSVLDVLNYIYENLDPSLGFYASCRRGCCGRCNMKINGKTRLACAELVTGDLKLEPVKLDKVVRDLKVGDL